MRIILGRSSGQCRNYPNRHTVPFVQNTTVLLNTAVSLKLVPVFALTSSQCVSVPMIGRKRLHGIFHGYLYAEPWLFNGGDISLS